VSDLGVGERMEAEARNAIRARESAEFDAICDAHEKARRAVAAESERVAWRAGLFVNESRPDVAALWLEDLREAVKRHEAAEAAVKVALDALLAFKRTA
jgi:hypothetical protein